MKPGFYFAISPHPEDDSNIEVRICSPRQPVRTLLPLDYWWPWEEPPGGGLVQHIYQLSSDQQLVIGCHKIFCLAEREATHYGAQAWFHRHLLEGRAIVFGLTDRLEIELFDPIFEQGVRNWFAYMQKEWDSAYSSPTHPLLQTVN